jgi:hypothetical protein
MRTFHVISFTIIVEQTADAPEDQSASRDLASAAIRHACASATELTGRQLAVRSIVLEPIQVVEQEQEVPE